MYSTILELFSFLSTLQIVLIYQLQLGPATLSLNEIVIKQDIMEAQQTYNFNSTTVVKYIIHNS